MIWRGVENRAWDIHRTSNRDGFHAGHLMSVVVQEMGSTHRCFFPTEVTLS
jgi:hypothetical protein